MARVKPGDVRKIIDTNRIDEQLQPLIDTASILVDKLLANAGYGEDLLTTIELWLSAHFIAVRDPRPTSKSIGDKSSAYHGQTGIEGLKQTPYGTQVMMLDYRGILSSAAAAKGNAEMEGMP